MPHVLRAQATRSRVGALCPARATRRRARFSGLLAVLALSGCPKEADPPAAIPPQATLQGNQAAGFAALEPRAAVAPVEIVLTGATVMTAAGTVHKPGWVHIADGAIAAVGSGQVPAEITAPKLDFTGRFITPGFIDTHSHLGVYPSPGSGAHNDGNEATAPATGGVWAEHSFWPQDPQIEMAVAGGVTTIQVLPGSANLVGGRGVVLHLEPERGARAMRLEGAPETLKMACGENPKRVYGEKGGPSTRMGNVRGHREAFIRAQNYQQEWRTYDRAFARAIDKGEDAPDPPKRDLELETLVELLEGRLLAQVHCYTADDMLSFLQVAEEFSFKVRSFHHALEAYKIRDLLAAREVAVSTWADWWGFKVEAYDGIPQNLALLQEAGVHTVVHTDSPIGIQRMNQEAAKGLRAAREMGLAFDDDTALRWITANPAWALGVEDQVGTLEVGKRADLVVWSGHPFSVYSKADLVFIDGALRYDRAAPGAPWSDFELGQQVTP